MGKDSIPFQPKMSTNKQIKVRTQVLCKGLRYCASMACHIRAYYSVEKKYTCDPCGLAFSLATRLNTHLFVIQYGWKFACEIYGSEYNHQELLKRHKSKSHSIKNGRKYKYDKE